MLGTPVGNQRQSGDANHIGLMSVFDPKRTLVGSCSKTAVVRGCLVDPPCCARGEELDCDGFGSRARFVSQKVGVVPVVDEAFTRAVDLRRTEGITTFVG